MGSSSNVGEIDIPSWLNCEFLANILSEEEKKSISVTGMDVEEAVPKGNNYLSTLYRITLQCNERNAENGISKYFLILKTLPKGEVLQKIALESQSFEKELRMYGSTLPAMYSAMKTKLHTLSARYMPTTMENVIVLEDLKQLGYKMANRHTGLDLEHCEITVRALARFHAASLALYKSDPASVEVYTEGLYRDTEEVREVMGKHCSYILNAIASNTEQWPGYENYADRIRNFMPTCFIRLMQLVKPKKDSLNVLNHGDAWVNNMMFHYCPETGKVDGIRLIDFQLARFSSPALDLQYFLCTSTNDNVRFREWDHLLNEYHAEFRDTLDDLDLDPDQFTLEQLKDEFEEKEMFGLLTVFFMLWAMLPSSDETPDFTHLKEDCMQNTEMWHPIDKAVSGRRYSEVLQTFLQYYNQKGLI